MGGCGNRQGWRYYTLEKFMKYGLQHNGKGKNHLIDDDNKELCGSSGVFLFTPQHSIEVSNGIFFMVDDILGKSVIPDHILRVEYCKKCLNKSLKIAKESRKQRCE